MKYSLWISKIGVFIGAGCVYLIGQYFRGQWLINTNLLPFCHRYFENGRAYCNSPYLDTAFAFIAAGEILAIAGVILLMANRTGLRRWAKMSFVYLPIGFLIIASAPPQEGGIFFTTGFSHEFLVWVLGVPYLLATLVVVAWSWYRR